MNAKRERVFVCSPYAGDVKENERRAEIYCDCLVMQGYNPFAPHLFYTRFLNDEDPFARALGIHLGIEEMNNRDWVAVCGWDVPVLSNGMIKEIKQALILKKEIRFFLRYSQDPNHQLHELDSSAFFRLAGYPIAEMLA